MLCSAWTWLDARKARLHKIIKLSKTLGAKTLRYLCDFEDGWEQTLTIERFADPVLSEFCPRLPQATGRPPPLILRLIRFLHGRRNEFNRSG
jgi:hypothetical protein